MLVSTFGHLNEKVDLRMSPYIQWRKWYPTYRSYLNKTLACLRRSTNAIKQIVRSGKKVCSFAH